MDLSVAMSDCFLKVEKDDKTTGIQQQLTSYKSPNRSQQICYFCPTFSRFCCTGLPDSLGPRKSQGLASEKPERIDLPGAALLAYQAEPMRFDQA